MRENPLDAGRILLVGVNFAPESTGIGPYATSFAGQMAAQGGFSVDVLTARPHYPGWRVPPKREWTVPVQPGVRVWRVRAYIPRRPTWLRRLVFEIAHGVKFACRSYAGIEAVVLVSPAMFTAAIVRARLALDHHRSRRPAIVLWIQDLYSAGVQELGIGAIPGRVVSAVERKLARASDCVVVIHPRFVDDVVERLGLDRARVHVIRNWHHQPTAEADEVTRTRSAHGWAQGETVVLHAGNMGVKQGLENVLQAAQLASELDHPVRFVFLGDGSQKAALIDAAGAQSNVEFIAPVSDSAFPATLAAADVLLVNELPGLRQTAIPSKLVAYFAAGRPVLAATEADSITAQEVRASGAGLVVPAGDPQALVAGVERLTNGSQPDRDAGPTYAKGVLSERAAISGFIGLLRNLMR